MVEKIKGKMLRYELDAIKGINLGAPILARDMDSWGE
jgi:hypothetical protein